MKLRVDQADITLAELADIETELGSSLGTVFDKSSAKAIAAIAWVTKRREDPTFTLADAMRLRMADLDIVTPESPGEASGGGNGTSPPASPGSGPSTPPTS